MRQNSFRKLAAAKGGMTLIEIVVSIAIIAIVALVIATAVSVNSNLIAFGKNKENTIDEIYAEADTKPSGGDSGTVGFSVGGSNYTVDGYYNSYSDTDGDVTFFTFTPENQGVTP